MEDKRVRYAQAVWHITQELRDADDLEEALGSCLEIVTETLRCAVSVVWLLDARCGLIHPMFYHGEANVRGHVIAKGEGIIGSVVHTGVSAMVEGATDESHFSQVPSASGSGVCNMLCVPLQNAYEIIGCIEVRYHLDGSPLDEHDLTLCEELAALAAVAIEERGLVLDFGPPHPVIVSLRDVSKSFDGGGGRVHALKGVNLDIYEGEFMVILGESGCGKTTLLNIVGGLETLSEGTLTVRGRDYSTSGSGELLAYRRDHVGYVFQEYHLMPNLSALENVEFVTEIVKDALPAREALHLVGLDERAGNFPSQLSGGQQQRVSIARALAKRPELILADEPTAALDYRTSIEVLAVMERLVREQGNTVIMVTHNPEIAKMADRVVRMRDGCLTSIQRNHHPRHANELVW